MQAKQTFDLYWSPEGKCIATVEAVDMHKAKRLAPKPYRKYLGEIYAKLVETVWAKCNVDLDCPRHGNGCIR